MDFQLFSVTSVFLLFAIGILYLANQKDTQRYKQRLYPVIVFLFMVSAIVGEVFYQVELLQFIKKLISSLEKFTGQNFPLLEQFGSNYPEWTYTFFLILVFTLYKYFRCILGWLTILYFFVLHLFSKAEAGQEKYNLKALIPAYGYDINRAVRFRPGWSYLYTYSRILCWIFYAAYGITLFLFFHSPDNYKRFLPEGHFLTFAFLFFLEVYWYLGQKQEKMDGTLDGENVSSQERGEFLSLWELYDKLCPERILAKKPAFQQTHYDTLPPPTTGDNDSYQSNLIKILEGNLAANHAPQITYGQKAALFNAFAGKDLLLIEPVFHYTNVITFALMQYHYLMGHHILVVVPPDIGISGRKELTSWLIREFGYLYFAKIELEQEETNIAVFDNLRLQVATMHEVLEYALSERSNKWFEKLTLVITPYGPRSFHHNTFQTATFCNFLADFCPESPQYVFLTTENRISEESSMRDFLKIEPVEHSFQGEGSPQLSFHIWKEEGVPAFQNALLWADGGTFFGHEAVLALPALQGGCSNIKICGDNRGVWEEEVEELEKISPEINVANRVKWGKLPALMETGQHEIVIARDTNHNVIETLQTGLALANKEVLLLVLANASLLRNYFCDNLEFFLGTQALASCRLSPRPIRSRASIAAAIAARLQSSWVDEHIIAEYLDCLADESHGLTIKSRMVRLFERIFEIDIIARGLLKTKEEYVFDSSKNHFEKRSQFRLETGIATSPFPSVPRSFAIQTATTIVEKIPADQFYQNFLPHQIHGFAGGPYKIDRIDSVQHQVHVSHHYDGTNMPTYRHLLDVTITKPQRCSQHRKETHQLKKLTVKLHLYEGKTTVVTYGYHIFHSGWIHKEYFPLESYDVPERIYPFGRILRLSIQNVGKVDDNNRQNLSSLFALLLTEILPTLFPETHRSLLICTPEIASGTDQISRWFETQHPYSLLPTFSSQGFPEANSPITIYFIEDASWDMGIIRAIQENWQTLFSLIEDYILWLLEKNMEDDFLKFGAEKVPEDFHFSELLELLTALLEAEPHRLRTARQGFEGRELISHVANHVCDFCGAHFSDASKFEILGDRRERCQACTQSAVDTLPAFEKIYKKARSIMEETFDIALRTNIHLKLADATTIAEAQGTVFRPTPDFNPRSVGLAVYKNGSTTIYIENGQPDHMVFSTCVHELTHCWQFDNLNTNRMKKRELLLEGHATWSEIFCLQLQGVGKDFIEHTKRRDDVYGRGFFEIDKRLRENGYTNPFEYLRTFYAASI